jgi:trans-2,3-dihydro-3-hydroxyanthranilate isomerase
VTDLAFVHVDVFSPKPFGGNPLPVFTNSNGLSADGMLSLTRELRQFEAIFLEPAKDNTVRARIFDLFEELPFAGHPLLGAAAVLQAQAGATKPATWTFDLAGRLAPVHVEWTDGRYRCVLDQGQARFGEQCVNRDGWAARFSLAPEDLHESLPLEVGSTGLRYLVIPVGPNALARARIVSDLTPPLEEAGAEFAVLFDPSNWEMRHWNNDGVVEDVATGSAAGVVAAYCLRHGLIAAGDNRELQQGRFAGRPSTIRICAEGSPGNISSVKVGGDVAIVGRGTIEAFR